MPSPKNRTEQIQEELERRILHGLACEWEAASGSLHPVYRNAMQPPLFSIRDMKRRLGYWAGEKREICLSRDLVFNHSWDSVCEVLRHEMAHQLATQVLGGRNEPPHGMAFKKACTLLRANPRASGKYPPLDEQIVRGAENSGDKIMRRVRKLMALSQSQNPHEAEAAMLKARELISRYNMELVARNEHREFISMFVGHPALRHTRDTYHLAHLVQDFYFVRGIWVPAYVIEKGKMGRVLEISGTVQNIKLADYVHHFVRHFTEQQWDDYNQKKRLNRYRRTDFAVGIIEGFRSKLEAQGDAKELSQKNQALVRVDDPLLKAYMAHRYPRTTRFTRKASRQDANVLEDGISVGKTLVISKGITEKRKSRKRLTGRKV